MLMAVMGELADVGNRLNREDQNRTMYDSQFSKWKVLIGPHDWEDYSAGKEGVSKYMVENLPRSSKPGVYELGIYCPGSSSRDHPGKFDPDKVLAVYLGKADNVRTRLQQYGRAGSHLCRSDFGVCPRFEDIFKRGCSIVFRWVPMENKADAWRREAKLLGKLDYPWNKGSNGERRHEDILEKLDKCALNSNKVPNLSIKHLLFLQKQEGIKIKNKLVLQDNEFSKYAYGENYNSLLQVFKFSKSLPRFVYGTEIIVTCGVVLEDGSICRRPPAEGRKRCAEHKGKKTKAEIPSFGLVPSLVGNFNLENRKPKTGVSLQRPVSNEVCDTICGVEFGNGYFCTKQPVKGRIRCEDHKGMKVTSLLSGLDAKRTSNAFDMDSRIDSRNRSHGSNSRSTSIYGGTTTSEGYLCPRTVVGKARRGQHSDYGTISSSSSICGASTCNGAPCQRPVKGNGRCFEHSNNGGSSISIPSSFSPQHSNYDGGSSSICGAPTCNGAPCQRTVKGNGRCFQHSNNGGSSISISSCFSPQHSNYDGGSSSICGAPTCNGTPCQRTVKGNGRCFQHSNTGSSSTSIRSYFSPQYSIYGGGSSSICGAPTRNGAPCQRTVRGNGRCWQH